MVRQISKDAYKNLISDGALNRKRAAVYEIIYKFGPMTGAQAKEIISKDTGTSEYSETVRNRITELCKMGLVSLVGKEHCGNSGVLVSVWDVTSKVKPIEIKNKANRGEIKKRILKWSLGVGPLMCQIEHDELHKILEDL